MAIKSDQVSVTSTKIAIHYGDEDGAMIRIRVSDECYIGNGDVTVNSGFLLEKDEIFEMFIGPGEVIYAVTNDGTIKLYYIMSLNE